MMFGCGTFICNWMLSKTLLLGGYHEIFVNLKPQMNADERRFVIAYLR